MPKLFALTENHYSQSEIEVTYSKRIYDYFENCRFEIPSININGITISFMKRIGSSKFTINLQQFKDEDEQDTDKLILNYIKIIITASALPGFSFLRSSDLIYFIAAERVGISVFSKDLFANRFVTTNEILENRNYTANLREILNENLNTYSLLIVSANTI